MKIQKKHLGKGKLHNAVVGIVASLLVIIIGAGLILNWSNYINLPKTGKSGNTDISKIFPEIKMADTVYVVESGSISRFGGGNDAFVMLESVQGIVAQKAAQLVILEGGLRASYVFTYAEAHPEITFKLFKFTEAEAIALAEREAKEAEEAAKAAEEALNNPPVVDPDDEDEVDPEDEEEDEVEPPKTAAERLNAEIIDITSVWDIVDTFKSHYANNGFITFLHDYVSPDINMAATIAGVERWISVPTTLKAAAIEHGYVERKNTANYKGDSVARQKAVFKEYKDRLNNSFVLHDREDYTSGRDIAIALKAFSFFTKDSYSSKFMQFGGGFKLNFTKVEDFIKERAFRHEVLSWADPAAPIIGFWSGTANDTDEMTFIQDVSAKGHWIVPYHDDANVAFMHAMEKTKVTKPVPTAAKAVAQEGKHYVALYITDGDNISWIYGSGSEGNLYSDRIKTDDTFKLSISYPPMLALLSPSAADLQFRIAEAANGGNNYFFSGVSGAGVAYPSHMPKKNLASYAALTAQSMILSDMNVVGLMEFIRLDPMWKSNAQKAVSEFAKYDNIKGGIYQIDGDKYVGGEGMFIWSDNGKPFITSKFSFWEPDGGVTDAWITDFARQINSEKNDYRSEDGYTVVCIQPWSIKYTDIQKLVAQLNSNVELVTVEELIDLSAANISR